MELMISLSLSIPDLPVHVLPTGNIPRIYPSSV